MKKKLSILPRILLAAASILLIISIFTPIWKIELRAPQYPEGLTLKIHADKLAGDVDIINGLNHYIGMKPLHADDFIEFTVLNYIIIFFSLFALVTAIIGHKKMLYTLFSLFVLFGVVAMVDFWRWEYDYGHNLNPHAAIIVPGMAYQPPLIGFKQLLNFGAYSIPDIGGWLFIGSGILMLLVILIDAKVFSKFRKNKNVLAVVAFLPFTSLLSCGNPAPEKINLNVDNCNFCKMTIADNRFCCELLTDKGRVYKFDDIGCMMGYKKENEDKMKNASFYACEYLKPNNLTPVASLTFIKGNEIGSPMGGNIAAFIQNDSANVYITKLKGEIISWETINQ